MNKKTFEYESHDQRIHFEYLDKLRASGVTNMLGSPAYLQQTFANVRRDQSYKIFQAWADTFEDRGCPGSDE